MMKRSSPATLRNRGPILEVLAPRLPPRGVVLEIASGTGEHAVHFARALPELEWQPTDLDPVSLDSIISWRAEAALPNVHPPLALDVLRWPWPVSCADAMFCANMIHISHWPVTEALFAGARQVLPVGAPLVTYGPYRFEGAFTSPSNQTFDQSLRQRDPRWGVRDVVDLARAAAEHGLALEETVEMPANNHVLVFRRTA